MPAFALVIIWPLVAWVYRLNAVEALLVVLFALLCARAIAVQWSNWWACRTLALPLVSGDFVTLFAHGHASTQSSAWRYTNGPVARWGETDLLGNVLDLLYRPLAWFWFYRLPLFGETIAVSTAPRPSAWNVGGEGDGKIYVRALRDAIAKYPPEKRFVLFGVSRGCATVISALAILAEEKNWEEEIRPRIAFVTLWSPFDTLYEAAKHGYPEWLAREIVEKYQTWASFDQNWEPLRKAQDYPQNLSTLVVAADLDPVVPFASSRRVYDTIRGRRAAAAAAAAVVFEALVGRTHHLEELEGDSRKNLVRAMSKMVEITRKRQ